jgi:hypothetical protein
MQELLLPAAAIPASGCQLPGSSSSSCLPVWPVWSGDCHTHLSQHIVALCCCCPVLLQALVCSCEAAACAGDQQAQHHNTASNSGVCQLEVRW